ADARPRWYEPAARRPPRALAQVHRGHPAPQRDHGSVPSKRSNPREHLPEGCLASRRHGAPHSAMAEPAHRVLSLQSDKIGLDLWSEPEPIVSQRFYCPDPPRDGRYHLPADEARHLARVCRHVPGDRVELFDGNGFATIARVREIGPDRVLLVAEGPPLADRSPRC